MTGWPLVPGPAWNVTYASARNAWGCCAPSSGYSGFSARPRRSATGSGLISPLRFVGACETPSLGDRQRGDEPVSSDAPPDDERKLIERARAGDEDAFEQIIDLHADRVYGALRRFGLAPGDAEDVTQEVFLRAWRGLGRFEGRARLSTWLYRIAFNEGRRRLGRREPAVVRPDSKGADLLAMLADAPQRGPGAQALDREFEATLERALRQLPADWRAAVVLRDLEGLSTREAAGALGIREAAFKRRLHRGRMQLRALLEPYLAIEET